MATKQSLKIFTELAQLKTNYETGFVEIIPGLKYSQTKILKMIEFYSNSMYIESQYDAQGREKPFYQILNGMVIVENAAKDIDTKDIQVTSDNGQYDRSFIMSKDIYEWMKATKFAKVINEIKEQHSRYGGVLVKKCVEDDKDGKEQLYIKCENWKNMITDQIDIRGGAKISLHWMLPNEILEKKDVWDNTDEALKLLSKTNKKGATTNARLPVYEVRNYFPRSFYKQYEATKGEEVTQEISKEDETDYSYQLYYIAGNAGDKQVIMYAEDDTEDVHKYCARKEKAGRGLGIGVFEEGEQAQIWTNDAVQKQTRAFDLVSRALGQTASKKLKGRNMVTEADHGTILEHEDGKPITAVPLTPPGGMAQFENIITQWFQQYERVTNSYSSQRGEAPPSGTAFRLQALVQQQSDSVFVDLKEDLELFIVEIFNDWIMPWLAERINKAHLLSHEFSPEELKEIDRNFALNRANQKAKEMLLGENPQMVAQADYEQWISDNDELIKRTKAERFLEIPENYYKDIESKVTVTAGNESRNKAAVLESITNIMALYAKNPQLATDPVLSQLFMRAVELSGAGISPINILSAMAESAKIQQQNQAMEAMNAEGAAPTPNAAIPTPVPQPESVTPVANG